MAIHERFTGAGSPDPLSDERSCEACGYELKGLKAGADCPECGTPESQAVEREPELPWSPREQPPAKCADCGHSLRGLLPSGTCPECGETYRPRRPYRNQEPLLPDVILESLQWRFGIGMMISGVILALLMQISSFGGSLTAQTNVIVMILASLAWASGLYLSLPASLDGGQLHMKVIRLLSIVSQGLWPIIFIGSWSLQGSSTGWSVAILKLITTIWFVLAVIGIVGIMCFLSMASKDLYMRRCSSRFQLLAVGLPLYVIVASLILSPAYIMSGLFIQSESGMNPVIKVILVGPWWITLLLLLLSFLQLLNKANWSVRIRGNMDTRSERVAAKREAMGAQVGQAKSGPKVEPPPAGSPHWDESGDIPLSDTDPAD